MRWRQFLTPVKSIIADRAREYMAKKPLQELTMLEVRQPNEYEKGHIPGAKLIPLPELSDRLAEVDPAKDTVVY